MLANFGVSFLFVRTVHPLSQNYQIWRGNMGEGRVFWCQPRLPSKRAEFQRSPIWGLSCIYAYVL